MRTTIHEPRSTSRAAAAIALSMALAGAGCAMPRTATRLTDMPRVDLQVEGTGNRGFLTGTPPPPGPQKTTRQMIGTEIEIPTLYKPTVTRQPADLGVPAASPAQARPVVRVPAEAPTQYDTYVVRRGDSLWSIAGKPEIYGKATHWRRIFDANRDILDSPDKLKAGMTLKIPRGEGGQTTFSDEGISPRK